MRLVTYLLALWFVAGMFWLAMLAWDSRLERRRLRRLRANRADLRRALGRRP